MEDSDPLFESIASDALKVLAGKRFFEVLDDAMCPSDPAQASASCDASYAISETVLASFGFDRQAIAEVILVPASRGGHCDCEILFNVAEESRMKTQYSQTQAREHPP